VSKKRKKKQIGKGRNKKDDGVDFNESLNVANPGTYCKRRTCMCLILASRGLGERENISIRRVQVA